MAPDSATRAEGTYCAGRCLRSMRFIALDTETTGVDAGRDRIVQLHVREVTWPLLATKVAFNVMLNPGIPIPAAATDVHGIRDQDVQMCPPFYAIAERLQSMLKGAVLIAYNGRRFDIPLLHNELVRVGCPGIPLNQPIIDPYEIFVQDYPRTLAGALMQYAGREHIRAHDPEADVDAMLSVLLNQLLTHPAPDVLEDALRPEKMPLVRGGAFYEDPDGVIRFGIGRHRDRPIAEYPDFLRWMLRRDFPDDVKAIAKKLLNSGLAAA